jgi:hopanoid biosynthesis associated radical SAM protein HpnH
VYLCTNAIRLEQSLDKFAPSPYFSFSVHLDGPREVHDHAVARQGIFDIAVSAIKAAKARGFRVTTNTTIFDGADPKTFQDFFDFLTDELKVDGMMISPGYRYEKAPDQDHFLAKEQTRSLFREIFAPMKSGKKRWQFNASPFFLDFLTGEKDYDCTPWGMPSYSLFGWQKPCYLLGEGYAKSYTELLETTEWEKYGHASGNPKCTDCMVHSGFEATAAADHMRPASILASLKSVLAK